MESDLLGSILNVNLAANPLSYSSLSISFLTSNYTQLGKYRKNFDLHEFVPFFLDFPPKILYKHLGL